MNFEKLRRTLNVLVEVAIKYNVYSGHLVLFFFVLFFSVQQPFLEELLFPNLCDEGGAVSQNPPLV